MSYQVYFAGSLFNHKDLIGNLLLCEKIQSLSRGKYRCLLPQNIEQSSERAEHIRNKDLEALLESDLAIFNFDGSELDSGTVVEFIFSKIIDMPVVIFRSDFRVGGDQQPGNDQWNLMCSFYPRTSVLNINSMDWYHSYFSKDGYKTSVIFEAYDHIAKELISALNEVRTTPSSIKANGLSLREIYRWAVKFPGGNFEALFDPSKLSAIIERKIDKGIYDY